MMQRLILILASLTLCAAMPAIAQDADPYTALREQDVRLAAIADRMTAANASLCTAAMPVTGLVLHSADQYASPRSHWFADGQVAVAAIVPGSLAQTAGIAAEDALVAVNESRIEDAPVMEGYPMRDTALNMIASGGTEEALTLTFRRNDTERVAELPVRRGCRVLTEILADNDDTARSDGRVIQISYGLASGLSDEELAVVFSHELGHVVLEHRRRLEEAGVAGGLLGEFGRNARLGRVAEVEADLISVHLLANARYDPAIAPAYWRSDARRFASSGIFRSRSYPSRRKRAEQMEEEIRAYLADSEVHGDSEDVPPSWPAHLIQKRSLPFPD